MKCFLTRTAAILLLWGMVAPCSGASSLKSRINGGVPVGSYSAILTTGEIVAVPEPQTWATLLGGLGALGFLQRLRRRKL